MTAALINARTTCYAVLGAPVSHSLSPQMHNAALQAAGLNAVYLPFEVGVTDLAAALDGMRRMGFGGANLTIPLKEAAFRLLNDLDDSARRLGAVNTIQFTPDGPRGYNTDGVGFLQDLRETLNLSLRDRRIMVLGCGGAGRAIALTGAAEGAAALVLANRSPSRARMLENEITARVPNCPCRIPDASEWQNEALACDIIVQCTASGMNPDDPPLLERDAFRPGQWFYDLVYVHPQTPIMRQAAAQGAAVANGLGMLLHQGAESFRIWTGIEPDIPLMRKTLKTLLYGKAPP